MTHLCLKVRRYRNLLLLAVVLVTVCSAETALAAGTPTRIPAEAPVSLPVQPTPPGTPGPEITRLEDKNPGPPFTIEVHTLRIEGGKYKVLGTVRNDGTTTYEGIGVIGTFYTLGPSGRGSSKDGTYPHGPVIVRCPCPFLEPGAACPFSLEIYVRNYVAYGLHPRGQPIAFFKWHEPAPVTWSTVRVSNDGIGNVRITGSVANGNAFAVKNAAVAGTLVDASGRIVSVGSTLVFGDIAPGASAPFDLRIKYAPYARYELYVQGVRY